MDLDSPMFWTWLCSLGNHFAASTGASLAELMGRIGHSTTRAAVIYQHRTIERDRLIAEAISAAVEAERSESERGIGHVAGTK